MATIADFRRHATIAWMLDDIPANDEAATAGRASRMRSVLGPDGKNSVSEAGLLKLARQIVRNLYIGDRGTTNLAVYIDALKAIEAHCSGAAHAITNMLFENITGVQAMVNNMREGLGLNMLRGAALARSDAGQREEARPT